MNKLDRVFQRDDVDRPGVADLVENRGESGGFAGARRSGNEHQAGLFTWNLFDNLREVQRVQRWNNSVELAKNDGIVAALREDADTEACLVGECIGGVAGAAAEQVPDMP